jgi:hypothetical protein
MSADGSSPPTKKAAPSGSMAISSFDNANEPDGAGTAVLLLGDFLLLTNGDCRGVQCGQIRINRALGRDELADRDIGQSRGSASLGVGR